MILPMPIIFPSSNKKRIHNIREQAILLKKGTDIESLIRETMSRVTDYPIKITNTSNYYEIQVYTKSKSLWRTYEKLWIVNLNKTSYKLFDILTIQIIHSNGKLANNNLAFLICLNELLKERKELTYTGSIMGSLKSPS